MKRPFWWVFLLKCRPVEQLVGREIADAVDRELESHQAAAVRQSARHQEALRRSDELRRQQVAELGEENDKLCTQLARSEAALHEYQWREVLGDWHDNGPLTPPVRPETPPDDDSATESSEAECDVFACMDCGSVLLRIAPKKGRPTYARPVGEGCATCVSLPLSQPLGITAVVAGAGFTGSVDLSAFDAEKRREFGAKLVVNVVKDGPIKAIAGAVAEDAAKIARRWADRIAPVDACCCLDAVATGLERIPNTVKSGIVWCATVIFHLPEFISDVIGIVGANVITTPLHLKTIACGLRMVDTIGCTAEDRLGQCAAARHLVFVNVGEHAAGAAFESCIREIIGVPATELSSEPRLHDIDPFEPTNEPPGIDPHLLDPGESRRGPDNRGIDGPSFGGFG